MKAEGNERASNEMKTQLRTERYIIKHTSSDEVLEMIYHRVCESLHTQEGLVHKCIGNN